MPQRRATYGGRGGSHQGSSQDWNGDPQGKSQLKCRLEACLRGLGQWSEGVIVVWEQFLAYHDKCSSCNHRATARPGAESKVISLGRGCQKSHSKIPQFPCTRDIMGNYPQCTAWCWLQLLPITPQTAPSSVSPSPGAVWLRHSSVPAQSCHWKPGMGAAWEGGSHGRAAEPARHSTEATPPCLVTTASFSSQLMPC